MKIFIADYLPLANKGEEEILRGIEVLFREKGDDSILFSVFGDVQEPTKTGNVMVFPKSICYPDFGLRGKKYYLACLLWAILDIMGCYPYRKRFLSHKSLIAEIDSSDKILIGHDGFFNIRCAMLGNYLNRRGYRYGIIGAGFNKPSKKMAWAYNKVYKRCFDNAEYVILREKTAFDYVSSLSHNSCIRLYPDPAFFCPDNEFNKKRVTDIMSKYGFNDEQGIKIGLTVCEDSISFSRAFLNSTNRVNDHREFIAKLIEMISNKYKCTFYFLPHCIKEGKGDDLAIAKNIKSRLNSTVDCRIIEEDMPVLDLKHIISKLDLLIGERTHSVINSIATATPFVSLTCSADFRTHDIVGVGCGLPQQIYDLDSPDLKVLFDKFDKTISNKDELNASLQAICDRHGLMKNEFQKII